MTADQRQRIAIVTGASAGIGLAIARSLVAEGHLVVGNARDAERLAAVGAELATAGPGRFVAVAGDAADRDVVARLFAACAAHGTGPDLFVVNAGRGLPGTVLTSNLEHWDEVFRTNCMGALLQMREAGRSMVVQAGADAAPTARDIVVIGSVVGRHVSPFNPVYGATKFAVGSLAEALRQELGKHFIRVTLIEPGIVRTDFQTTAGYDMASFNAYEGDIGPFLAADDIARFVMFAISQPAHVHFNDVVVRPTRQPYP